MVIAIAVEIEQPIAVSSQVFSGFGGWSAAEGVTGWVEFIGAWGVYKAGDTTTYRGVEIQKGQRTGAHRASQVEVELEQE